MRKPELEELSGRTTGRLGRQGWHYDSLSAPQLPPDQFTMSNDYGPDGAVGSLLPPGLQDLPGATGRMEQREENGGVHRGTRKKRPRGWKSNWDAMRLMC
jgi:hypothetical protein